MIINAAEHHRYAFVPFSQLPPADPNAEKKTSQVAKKSLEKINPFPFAKLPKIAQYCVLSHMNLPTLAEFSLASKEASNLVSHPHIWKPIAVKINCPVKDDSPIIYKQVLHFIASIQKKALAVEYRPEDITTILKGPNTAEIDQIQQWLQAEKTLEGWKNLVKDFTDRMLPLPDLNSNGLNPEGFDDLTTSQEIIDKAEQCAVWMQENKALLEARDTLIIWRIIVQAADLRAAEAPLLFDLDSPDAVIEKASEFGAWFSENAIELIDNVDSIDLSNKFLTSLPKELFNLSKLKALYLQNNLLSTLPNDQSISGLEYLNISNNRLSSLPAVLSELSQLKVLFLESNRLTSLPDEICQLSSLTELLISCNDLSSLPNGFGNFTHLQTLSLHHNRLISLPNDIGNLSRLETLGIAYNLLTSLPNDLRGLPALKSLSLAHNLLISLPSELGDLQLQDLYLNYNLLTSLPDGLIKLHDHLNELKLGGNLLSPDSVPEQLRYALKKD